MLFDKQQIMSMISDPQQAAQAAQQLPDQVDHEAHGDLLQRFGVDPGQLAGGGDGQGYGQGSDGPGMGNDPGFQQQGDPYQQQQGDPYQQQGDPYQQQQGDPHQQQQQGDPYQQQGDPGYQ